MYICNYIYIRKYSYQRLKCLYGSVGVTLYIQSFNPAIQHRTVSYTAPSMVNILHQICEQKGNCINKMANEIPEKEQKDKY